MKGFFDDEHVLRQVTSFGWLGVESFFVISGFVIPLAMFRAGYVLPSAWRFLVKRYLRLAPPYLACLLVVVVLGIASSFAPGFQGDAFSIEGRNLLSHVFYLNDFLDLTWLNPVFWTLAIELQYYFVIALTFPLLFNQRAITRRVAYCIAMAIGLVSWSHDYVFAWTYVFLVGITLGHFYFKICSRLESAVMLTGAVVASLYFDGIQIGVVSAMTALGIAGIKRVPDSFKWLGMISYSLYLLHVPIGGRVINLSKRFVDSDFDRCVAVTLAMAISLVCAHIFYKLVELPSHRLSRCVHLRPSQFEITKTA